MSICFSVQEGVISLTVFLEASALLACSSALGGLAAAQLVLCIAPACREHRPCLRAPRMGSHQGPTGSSGAGAVGGNHVWGWSPSLTVRPQLKGQFAAPWRYDSLRGGSATVWKASLKLGWVVDFPDGQQCCWGTAPQDPAGLCELGTEWSEAGAASWTLPPGVAHCFPKWVCGLKQRTACWHW